MSSNLPANAYTLGGGLTPLSHFVNAVIATSPPTSDNIDFSLGQIWVDKESNDTYILTSFSTSTGVKTANWQQSSSSSGFLSTLSGDTGTAVPSSNNITIAGGTNMNTSAASSTVTINLDDTLSGLTSVSSDTFLTSNATQALQIDDNDITATGTNPNVNIDLIPKGSGSVQTTADKTSTLFWLISNTNNATGNAHASLRLSTGGASAGDPYLNCAINGAAPLGGTWSIGYDNTASAFVLSNDSILGSNNALSIANNTRDANFVGGVTANSLTSVTTVIGDALDILVSGAHIAGGAQIDGHLTLVTDVGGVGIEIETGADSCFGTGTLTLGTETVNSTQCTALSSIFVSRISKGASTAVGTLEAVAGSGSFVVTSLNPTDGTTQTNDISTYSWLIINPT